METIEGTQDFAVGGNGASPATQGAEQAKRIGRTMRGRVFSALDGGKDKLADQLDGLLGKLPKFAEGELPLIGDGVDRVRSLSDTLREKNAEELLDEVRFQAHQRPGYFMLGAFALGFLGARLLRDVGSDG